MSYPTVFATPGLKAFAEAVDDEAQRQHRQWGEQRHPDGTGRPGDRENADRMRAICKANGPGQDNWRDILAEEIAEAFAETDPELLVIELVQCAAVIQNWINTIKGRSDSTDPLSADAPRCTCAGVGFGNGTCAVHHPPADEDTERAARRDSLRVLLGRAQRVGLTWEEGDLLRQHVETEIREADTARRERDLAVAHDRQPYPTAWAYEQACKALHRKTEAIERVRALRDPIAAALEQADYRVDMRRGDLVGSIMPVILAALDGTEQLGTDQEQGAPTDWKAIVRDRERELKKVGKARHRAEAAIERVRQMTDAWEQRLPETILTATAVEALRAALYGTEPTTEA